MSELKTITVGGTTYTLPEGSPVFIGERADWDALTAQQKAQYDESNGGIVVITDDITAQATLDDTKTTTTNVWSASKVNTELSAKANSADLANAVVSTTLTVNTSNWTTDTTSQSGTTLYKKQISLNHVYVDSPNVDIGASGVLPTTAEQEAYNLIQYVTVDDTVPCLYLYASDTPSNSFYIKVGGVD